MQGDTVECHVEGQSGDVTEPLTREQVNVIPRLRRVMFASSGERCAMTRSNDDSGHGICARTIKIRSFGAEDIVERAWPQKGADVGVGGKFCEPPSARNGTAERNLAIMAARVIEETSLSPYDM
ncbi:hypothetical protein KM043_010063 [Ampulex compressa]|nr:hypothetical protein KM043_010063 [Ampulex compressa]